jgi:hypothetical protein
MQENLKMSKDASKRASSNFNIAGNLSRNNIMSVSLKKIEQAKTKKRYFAERHFLIFINNYSHNEKINLNY